jgi:hypothetical protein
LILIIFYIFTGEENFLKKVFLPPNPHLSKTLKRGGYFFVKINAFDRRAINVHAAPTRESFGQAFSKACGFGQSP